MSMVDAVEKILTEAGKPLHANVLVEELKKYGRNTNNNSVRGTLPQDAKERFVNIGGNTWALVAWPRAKEQTAKA